MVVLSIGGVYKVGLGDKFGRRQGLIGIESDEFDKNKDLHLPVLTKC